uniref:Uncharacterized protein n=1 Tax=Leersia perrieri TaxID=77586 RepID=A0A0D9WC14_9ORYZ
MAMEPIPLGFGDAMDATLLSSLWAFQDDLQPQESMEEVKQSLMATTMELEAAKEELKKKEQTITKLADLLRHVAKDRDHARDQLNHLLAAAKASPSPSPPPPPPPPPPPALVTSSVTDSDGSFVSSPIDITSSDKRFCGIASPPAIIAGADAALDMLAMKKPLPVKGRLLQSVMEAGPLLQNLLVAGLLPRWRNPPPVALDTLPVGVRSGVCGGYSGMSSMAPAPALGYGVIGGGGNGCGKRPMPAMSMAAAAAAGCSPAFGAKRHRLH